MNNFLARFFHLSTYYSTLIARSNILLLVFLLSACSMENDIPNDCGCEHEGVCITDNLGEMTCQCPDGYVGVYCEVYDECHNITCSENQQCIDGTCVCMPGFGGNNCQEILREKYYGDYQTFDICPGGTYGYEVKIKASGDGLQYFEIEGFGSFNDPILKVKAEVKDTYTFEIPIGNYPGVTIQSVSTGHYDPDTGIITVSYQSTIANSNETCDLTLTPL